MRSGSLKLWIANYILRFIAGSLLLLGGTVMLGWGLRVPRIVQVIPDYGALVFSSAICFALAGCALIVRSPFNALRYSRWSTLCGGAVAIIALLALLESSFQSDLYIDWRSLHAWLKDTNPNPGRMSTPGALAFLMAGTALVLSSRVRHPWVGSLIRMLTLGVGGVGLLAFAGYVISAHLLFPEYWFAGISVHAAAGYLLLSTGLWLVWKHLGWGKAPLLAADDDRITFIGAVIVATVALLAGITSFATLQRKAEALAASDVLRTLDFWTATFEDQIDLHERNARLAATRSTVLRNLRIVGLRRDDGSNLANLRSVAAGLVAQEFKGVAYHDVGGNPVASAGVLAEAPDMVVSLATPQRGELLWSGGLVLRHRIPLFDSAGQVGWIVTEKPLPVLTGFAVKSLRIAPSAETGLCVLDQAQLRCFPNQVNARVFSAPLLNAMGEALPMTQALQGRTGTILTRDYRGQRVIAAMGRVGEFGLGMVVKVSTADIYKPIRDQLGLASGLLVALVAGGTLLLRSQVKPLASKLRESREEFQAVTETASDAIVSADAEGRITYFNHAAETLFGYSFGEALGEPLTLLIPDRMRESHSVGFQRFLATRQPSIIGKTVEVAAKTKQGSEVPIEVSIASRTTGKGVYFTAILRDITARRQAADALRKLNEELEQRVAARTAELNAAFNDLRQSELYYRMLFDANPHPMWVYDPNTLKFLAVNDAASEHYGYTKDRFLQMTVEAICPDADGEQLQALIRTLDRGQPHRGVYRHQKAGGELIDVEVVSDRIEFAGSPARLVLAHDITQRQRAEEEIRRLNAELEERVRQRTAEYEVVNKELEAFSYSVSHDLRAPLRHIAGFARLLEEDAETQLAASGRRYIGIILDSVSQMGRLIDELLAFSKMGRAEMHRDEVSMVELVQEVLAQSSTETAGRSIEWEMEPLPKVLGDRPMLKQVWFNLIANAIKYTCQRELAKVKIGYTECDDEFEFRVQDNGAGFEMKYVDKLFGVFQRLHRSEEFEGTGVGLAIVQRIVMRHGGRVSAEGKIDEGATFCFTLPKHQSTPS